MDDEKIATSIFEGENSSRKKA